MIKNFIKIIFFYKIIKKNYSAQLFWLIGDKLLLL